MVWLFAPPIRALPTTGIYAFAMRDVYENINLKDIINHGITYHRIDDTDRAEIAAIRLYAMMMLIVDWRIICKDMRLLIRDFWARKF